MYTNRFTFLILFRLGSIFLNWFWENECIRGILFCGFFGSGVESVGKKQTGDEEVSCAILDDVETDLECTGSL